MTLEEVKTYLPKYLSAESEKELYDELRKFPEDIEKNFIVL